MRHIARALLLILVSTLAFGQSEPGSNRVLKTQTDTIKSFDGLSGPLFPNGMSILEGGASPTFRSTFLGGDQTGDVTYTLPVADGTVGQLLRTDGSGSLSWITQPVPTGTANTVAIFDGSGALVSSSILYDQSNGLASANVDSRLLFDTSGTISVVDWGNNILYDNANEASLNWFTRIASDYSAAPSINWDNRTLRDVTNLSAVAWGDRILLDTSGNSSVDWQNNFMVDAAANTKLDWGIGHLIDEAGITSVNWNDHQLDDATGVLAVDVNPRNLYESGGSIVLDWQGLTLNTASAVPSVNWGTFSLQDASAVQSAEWNSRALIDQTGTIQSLNWVNRTANDSTGGTSIDWNTHTLIDSAAFTSVDWGNRVLDAADGSAVASWNFPGEFAVQVPLLSATNITAADVSTTTLDILEGGGSPTFHTIFQGGDQAGNITYTLPVADGSSGQLLQTNGSGILSWANSAATDGTYMPTLFNTANLSASTPFLCQYLQNNSTVDVSCKVTVDPVAMFAATKLELSLPVASNLAGDFALAGTAATPTVAGQSAAIYGNIGGNTAVVEWVAVDTTSQPMFLHFMYHVTGACDFSPIDNWPGPASVCTFDCAAQYGAGSSCEQQCMTYLITNFGC